MIHCAACGYPEETHEFGTQKCHVATADKNGRRGAFRAPPEPDPALWPEILRRDMAARVAAIEAAQAVYVPEVVLPPQVPARPPRGPGEIAGYGGKQAVGLGRAAVARGWAVEARYWRAADGTEGCAVRLTRADLRAVATWKRARGNIGKSSGWAGDVAYGWRLGTMPARINHTDLLEVICADS